MENYNCLVVLGATASGKTRLACQLAYYLNGEIISADSRQVYKQLDIGTGKDLQEYHVNGEPIAYHLIDLVEPGEQFYLHQFMAELKNAFDTICAKNKLPVICGGTGLYLDALRKDFSLTQIKENAALRNELEPLSKEEVVLRLKNYPAEMISHVDLDSKKRMIRGIEIADYLTKNKTTVKRSALPYQPYYIGISTGPETRKQRISERLKKRLDEGLIDEVNSLLNSGVTQERLELFGLEYKFVSHYLQHKLTKDELFTKLQTAIFQFAKRQMTWFRKMEKEGVKIHWVDPSVSIPVLVKEIKERSGF
jgi:tRNA dimethylallyltransferase